MTRRSLHRFLWSVAILVLAYAFITTFVMHVRYVDSGSMEPTIFGSEKNGESVLVRLDKSLPNRFDLVVLNSPENGLLVKRVWGLPEEKISIRNGDVYVDDSLLPNGGARPNPITVFDYRWHALEEYFVTKDTPWTRDGDSWLVSAEDVEPYSEGAMIFLHKKVQDSYLDRDHRIIQGTQVVNDLVARLELRFEERVNGGSFRIDLRECEDSFEALIEPIDDARARVTITRSNAEVSREVLSQEELAFTNRDWNAVEFSNIDNQLELKILTAGGEEGSVVSSYEVNSFDPLDDYRSGKTLAHQVQFAAARSQLRVRSVQLARDLFFNARGRHATRAPIQLGLDQILVLGDNSGRSRDSREFGAVDRDQIYGRAVQVVWPFSSWRSLTGK